MISVVRHRFKGSELLNRKFQSMRARVDAGVIASLRVDDLQTLDKDGALFEEGRGGVKLLVMGVVGDVRLLSDGRRQILALHLPGDFLAPTDSERLIALTPVRVADGAPLVVRLADVCEANQPLRRAWRSAARTDQAMLRDQVVRLGRMSAFERVAHLLLETHERIAQVALNVGTTFHLPLTQEMLGDVIGLSVVHLNRTLQALRRNGLIVSRNGYVTLVDRPQLIDIAKYVSRFPIAWRVNR